MRLSFWFAMMLTIGGLAAWDAYGQQSGSRVCSTTTSGSISHEYCTFTPLVVQAPAVTVLPAAVTVQPAAVVMQPAPAAKAPEKKVRE